MISNVSNFDRILTEIKKESQTVSSKYALSTDALIELVVYIVDLEDQKQKGRKSRKKDVEDMIFRVAVSQINTREST